MKPTTIAQFFARQSWLEPLEHALSAVASVTLKPAGQSVRNFLHGTWFGHPLHPALIDVPLGAWSVTTLLDLYEWSSDDTSLARGADAALGIGLVASLGAAASGLNDWKDTDKPARRIGALHGMLNLTAMGLYFTSWLKRKSVDCDDRDTALGLSFGAWLLAMCAAYLGGHLVYGERIGVDHGEREPVANFTPVMPEKDLGENEPRRVRANGVDILIVRRLGKIFAIGEKCAHLGGPLSEGKFERDTVTCPWHGSQFSLANGAVLNGPAVFGQPCFETRVHEGNIEVRSRKTEA